MVPVLVGNTIAIGDGNKYDWIAGAIEPFVMSDHVGIAAICSPRVIHDRATTAE